MNIYKEIKQSALFREMSFFLKHLGVSEDTFLDSVFNKSNTAINILRTLHNYKFFGVIIPINELLLPYFDKETRLWWDNTLSSMERNRTVAEIAEKFHNLTTEDDSIFEFASNAAIQTYVWNSYPTDKTTLLQQNPQQNIGVLLPGRFNIDNEYISLLTQYGIPALADLANKKENIIHPEPYKNSVIQKVSSDYISELAIKYNPYFQSRANRVFELTEAELEQLRPADFRNIIMEEAEDFFVPTDTSLNWIESLRTLINIYYKYNRKSNDSRLISQILVILMQCVGLNSDASDLLCSVIEDLDTREKSSVLLLMGLYRALSSERNSYRTKLFEIMRAIFAPKALPDEAVWLTEDICNFYEAYCDDITNRFNEEKLLEVIAQSDDINGFYYNEYLLEYRENRINKDIRWVSENLFENHKVPSFFRKMLDIINSADSQYYQKLLAFKSVSTLLHSMFSHEDDDPRLITSDCIQILNLDEKATCCPLEIFYLYSPHQIDILRKYMARLYEINKKLPSPDTVIHYQGISFDDDSVTTHLKQIESMVYRHEEKILEHDTQIECMEMALKLAVSMATANNSNFNELILNAFRNNPDEIETFYKGISELHADNADKKYKVLDDMFSFAQHIKTTTESDTPLSGSQVFKAELPVLFENFAQLCPLLNNLLCCGNILRSLTKILKAISK